MSCKQFLAPNGEVSLLYTALEQKYGSDRAVALWNWAKTLPIPQNDTVDISDFSKEEEYYRVIVGDSAFNDIVLSGVVRTNAQNKQGESLADRLKNRPTLFPSFSKGKASIEYAAENPNNYIIVTTDNSIKPSTAGRHGKGTTMFPTDENGNHLKELSGKKVKVYKHVGNGKYELVYDSGNLIEFFRDVNGEPTLGFVEANMTQVNYKPKLVSALFSADASILYTKFFKDNPEKFYQELTGKAGKQQIQWLRDYVARTNPQSYEELITGIAAEMSYTVEIRTAMDQSIQLREGTELIQDGFNDDGTPYYVQADEEYVSNVTPTKYYEYLTVPGGTNYTENEIATPAITPSIRGHAAFTTDNGIGWFRSDEQTEKGTFSKGYDLNKLEDLEWERESTSGTPTKTRRILEVQSDLFQKGREHKDLIGNKEGVKESFPDEMGGDLEIFNPLAGTKPTNETQNNFLQLLNKDNAWVTFFVKSIIQDSQKKGYEKVLFPKGDTAAKIEGHQTVEEFITYKQQRINELQEKIENPVLLGSGNLYIKDEYDTETGEYYSTYLEEIIDNDSGIRHYNEMSENKYREKLAEVHVNYIKTYTKEIQQLEQEVEDAKAGKLKISSIANFYETTVHNVLKKQGFAPTVITDEYGNEWYEVVVPQNIVAINLTQQKAQEIELPLTDFAGTDIAERMNGLVNQAKANPETLFKLPFKPDTRVKFRGQWYSGLSLANVMSNIDLPVNIVYDESFGKLFSRLPKNFIERIEAPSNPLAIDGEAVTRQMNQFFVQIKDVNGVPTGKWFDYDVQKDAIDGIMYSFAAMFDELNNSPKLQQEMMERRMKMLSFIRSKVFQQLDNERQIWNQVVLASDPQASAEQKARIARLSEAQIASAPAKVVLYNNVMNSFDGKNGLWTFSLERMKALGMRFVDNGFSDDTDKAIVTDEDGTIQFDEGTSLKDFSDSSLGLDQKDTASARIKLFLATIPQSRIGPEPELKRVDLLIGNQVTQQEIHKGITDVIIVKSKLAADKKWMPSKEMTVGQRTALEHQRVISVMGKDFRATASGRVSPQQLSAEFIANVKEQFGFEPSAGDLIVSVEPYERNMKVLSFEPTIFGKPRLNDFEQLFQDLAGLLAGAEASWPVMRELMASSGNANILKTLEKLEAPNTKEHIRKEFVSVFSAHYQRQLMVLLTRSRDGLLEANIIDSNRNSEKGTIINFWAEAQKTSGLLKPNAVGTVVVDQELARSLMEELKSIYALPVLTAPNSKELQEKYGRSAEEVRKRLMKELEEKKTERANLRKEFFRKVLDINGIQMHPEAFEEVYTRIAEKGKGTGVTAIYGGFSNEGEPNGMVDRLVWSMNNADESVEDTLESYKLNNPLYTRSTEMNILASAQLKYTPQIYSQTHKSIEGKTIYSYGLNSALSHDIRKFKSNVEFRKRYETSLMGANNWLYQALINSPKDLDRFTLTYLDGLKNRYGGQDGTTRSDMSDREQWLTALSLYINGGNKYMHMLSLTHSDKTKSPLFMNVPRITDVLNSRNEWTDDVVGKVFASVFMPEFKRALSQPGSTYAKYDVAKNHFFYLPMFNKENMSKMVAAGTLSQQQMNLFWNKDTGQLNNNTAAGWQEMVYGVIRRQLNHMYKLNFDAITSSGLFDAGIPGNDKMIKKVIGAVMDTQGLSLAEMKDNYLVRVIKEYTLNDFMFNTSLSQLFYGDPALTWKGSVTSTMDEYGKRLAKDIAPGRDGDFSHSPSYVAVTVSDFTPAARELSEIPGYEKVEATDAQELTTVEEHLDVLYAYGKITSDMYTQAINIVKRANGGYYEFPKELENVILQPMKPVVAGLRDPDMNGVMYYDYVKSSSFPLYPPTVAGLELDKLRKAMEKGGVRRINFASARKIGNPAGMATLFNVDGSIREDAFTSKEWLESARQELSREQFRIQQEVPYDEFKDEILTVSQMNKLITEHITSLPTLFTYKGEQVSGKQLRGEKERIRTELIQKKFNKFLSRIGAEYNAEEETLYFKDKKKLYQALAEEARSRSGYTTNDILALTSYEGDKLKLPLMFAPSANRFESLIMSMIKQVVQVKMPGKSYVQGSPAGFQVWEEMTLKEQNAITWVGDFRGPLLTARKGENGEILPAQILLPFNYFDQNGDRINIQDFLIIGEDGRRMIDLDSIPRELLQMIGARIPNQGHSSMLPLEVVGFLPEKMGDLVIVPAAITKQMGADFDVDKLYTYHRKYTVTENGKLQPVGIYPGKATKLKWESPEIQLTLIDSSKLAGMVEMEVFNEDTGQTEVREVPAKEVHDYIKEEYKSLKKLLQCIG